VRLVTDFAVFFKLYFYCVTNAVRSIYAYFDLFLVLYMGCTCLCFLQCELYFLCSFYNISLFNTFLKCSWKLACTWRRAALKVQWSSPYEHIYGYFWHNLAAPAMLYSLNKLFDSNNIKSTHFSGFILINQSRLCLIHGQYILSKTLHALR
jgi:hypothetical protein